MSFAGMNYLAVVVAAVVAFAFGGIYYRLLSKPWLAASGVRKEDVQGHPWGLYATAAVALLVMAWVLAGVIGHLVPAR